jgi:LuxR family maltose regulon positive regulatory protein
MVPRRRLLARLREARAPLTLVAAPAGYGKTTLLAQWDRCDNRPFAWLTVDKTHNESVALVEAIEQALGEVAPAPSGRSTSTRSRRGAPAVAVARLVRSLSARGPFVLVLDDLHALDADGALEVVRTLTRHVPTDCRLALATRTEPALPAGRLRANRELTEIRPRDLAMTSREAADLLAMSGLDLSDHDAEELTRKAEGWPAGLYLAAVALRGQSNVSGALRRFGGDDAIVADYLRDEVLSQLPQEVVSFLMRTSILERLSGPACDAVLDRRDSGQLLSSIGRSDLLLVPLDRQDETYRCHRLLAQMLRAELRRSLPEEDEAHLHRRASDWYADRGEVDQAVHHAVAAGDTARAADLLGPHAPEYVTRGRIGTMQHWLSSFTHEQIAGHPTLVLAAANSHLLAGELDAVHRWESAARRTLHETPPNERSAAHEATVKILHAAAGRDGVIRMGQDAASAYALEPEDSPWRPICCLFEGVACYLTGDREAAEARLEEGVRRGASAAPNVQTLCLAELALMASERADWESAAGFTARAVAQVEHYALGDYPTSALVLATSALVRSRRGRVEAAQDDAREATRLLSKLDDFIPWYLCQTKLALAAAAARLSDTARARDLLADASRIARRLPEAVVLRERLDLTRARVETAAAGPALLTTAELRILTFLPTHLSFREIAGRLYVSANTVKTQAHAVYRKLDAASRSEAVTHARQLGLLDV